MLANITFPPSRGRLLGAPVKVAEKFGRYESTDGHVTLADTDAEIITFSGRPDMIRLVAHLNNANVLLTDRLNRETDHVHIHEGEVMTIRIGRDRVIARNADVGVNAQLSVEGFWAEPDEAIHGRESFRP